MKGSLEADDWLRPSRGREGRMKCLLSSSRLTCRRFRVFFLCDSDCFLHCHRDVSVPEFLWAHWSSRHKIDLACASRDMLNGSFGRAQGNVPASLRNRINNVLRRTHTHTHHTAAVCDAVSQGPFGGKSIMWKNQYSDKSPALPP